MVVDVTNWVVTSVVVSVVFFVTYMVMHKVLPALSHVFGEFFSTVIVTGAIIIICYFLKHYYPT